ncbi:MAG: shikimate dehydrogenase [Acetanaerobacterium sp.]
MGKLHFAVLGYPLEHTLSPALHSRLFALSGVDAQYTTASIAPEEFCARISELFTLNGFNITMPYKQRIILYLDGATEEALRFQAVNTVLVQPSGRGIGHNTDIAGVIKSFERLGASLRGNICIAGAGATARMIATEIVRRGGRVTIAIRQGSFGKGEALARAVQRLSAQPCVAVRTLESLSEPYDLLINATPCGMYPNVNGCVFPDRVLANAGGVFDLIYNPYETQLLAKTRALGKPALGGLPMLAWQAAAAHEFWYGAEFTPAQIDSVVDELCQIL